MMNQILFNLQLFTFTAGTTAGTPTTNPVNIASQTTTGSSMSPTMKTFYDTTLLENARDEMVYDQFGKKVPIKGRKAEFRKFNTFPKAMTALTEGVIPSGENFGMTNIEAETTQHGDYVAVSDRLELEAYDDVIFGATEEMGAAEGATYDTLTRNVLIAGTSVAYCPIITSSGETAVTARTSLTNAAILTPKMVHKAATWLKKNKAPKINGYYVALIHPSVAFDLTNTDEWISYHKHTDVAPIFKGEIGELFGVRFIETNTAKIHALAGAKTGSEDSTKVATYDTLFLGKDAFGILEPSGESMEMIVKGKGEIGGPLEQFSTIGYKFCHAAKILYQERMLRVESGSSYGSIDEEN